MYEYYRLKLDCEIYIKSDKKMVLLSVPAYSIFERIPYWFKVSSAMIQFRYYKYRVKIDLLEGALSATSTDEMTTIEQRVLCKKCTKKEYKDGIQYNSMDTLLRIPYECRKTGKIPFEYNNAVSFPIDGVPATNDELNQITFIVKWMASQFRHISVDSYPQDLRARQIYNKAKESNQMLNCRNLAVMLNGIFLSRGFYSRYVICLQKEKTDDCHFMVEVFWREKQKWIAIDSSYSLLFRNNNDFLSIREIRDTIVNEKEGIEILELGRKISKELYWKNMMKKLYAFRRSICSNDYYNETEPMVQLVPRIDECCEDDRGILAYCDCPKCFWEK